MNRKWSDEQLMVAVQESTTFADVMRKLGLQLSAGNYPTLKRAIRRLGLDISHMLGKRHGRGVPPTKISLDKALIEHSTYNPYHLKARLIKEGILSEQCAICKSAPVWLDKPLVLILDHVNGVHDDDRIENLRLLCPNCNSQTETFSRGTRRKKIKRCSSCNAVISKTSVSCRSCATKKLYETLEIPDASALKEEAKKEGTEVIAQKYGVSGNSIRKRIRQGSRQMAGQA